MATGSRGKRRGKSDEKSRSGDLIEKVVKIKRCAAVVKGGRRFSFAAMVVLGDGIPDVFTSGTHDGSGDASVLSDSGKSWDVNQYAWFEI